MGSYISVSFPVLIVRERRAFCIGFYISAFVSDFTLERHVWEQTCSDKSKGASGGGAPRTRAHAHMRASGHLGQHARACGRVSGDAHAHVDMREGAVHGAHAHTSVIFVNCTFYTCVCMRVRVHACVWACPDEHARTRGREAAACAFVKVRVHVSVLHTFL